MLDIPMVSATRTATSGLKAASRVVAAVASNVANLRTTSPPEDVDISPSGQSRKTGNGQQDTVYRPLRVEQEALEGGGVSARYGLVDPSHVTVFDPGDPNANEEGLVAQPNVDPAREMLNLGLAQRAYEASLKVIETEDEMSGSLLDSPT